MRVIYRTSVLKHIKPTLLLGIIIVRLFAPVNPFFEFSKFFARALDKPRRLVYI